MFLTAGWPLPGTLRSAAWAPADPGAALGQDGWGDGPCAWCLLSPAPQALSTMILDQWFSKWDPRSSRSAPLGLIEVLILRPVYRPLVCGMGP